MASGRGPKELADGELEAWVAEHRVVVTADHDPLRDEGDALAQALRTARVPVIHRCEPGMVHGFIQNLDLVSPAAARATARFQDDARRLLSTVRAT